MKMNETVMERINRERLEKRLKNQESRKRARMEFIGMLITLPLVFFGMIFLYCWLWGVTPSYLW